MAINRNFLRSPEGQAARDLSLQADSAIAAGNTEFADKRIEQANELAARWVTQQVVEE